MPKTSRARATELAASEPDLEELRSVSALYFLDGDYYFRHVTGESRTGKFVSPSAVRAAFVKESVDTGWLPEGIVRFASRPEGDVTVLFSPPQRYTIGLLGDGRITPATVPLPGLVLAGIRGEYKIWAVKSKHFDPEAVPHFVPLPNVYHNCGICWGQVRPPAPSPGTMHTALANFLDSTFTPNETRFNRSAAHPEDIRVHLTELAGRGASTYPVDDLVPVEPATTVARAVENAATRFA